MTAVAEEERQACTMETRGRANRERRPLPPHPQKALAMISLDLAAMSDRAVPVVTGRIIG